ncbi:hypothetical protein [Parabacteroides sp. PF5-9]|uniref:hypothetical protein n=1 Tax=Parabacteroides sp. PF5-9 TaxID=1742404 RepID=UPI0024767D4C|nr:hypothetical protein [Parabacteroides sp. PF5-9]MDH6356968.1 hypothetical protein [Parabacteroides sp. PF5-9]
MVREIDGDVLIDMEGADRDSVKYLREGLISLMADIAADNVGSNGLNCLAWIIRELKDE